MRRYQWEQDMMERDLRIAAVIAVVGTILLTSWLNYGVTGSVMGAGPGGKDLKEQATMQEQSALPQGEDGTVSVDHPHAVSSGLWTFLAYGLAGVFGLAGIWFKFRLSRRMHRMRLEAEANKNRSVM